MSDDRPVSQEEPPTARPAEAISVRLRTLAGRRGRGGGVAGLRDRNRGRLRNSPREQSTTLVGVPLTTYGARDGGDAIARGENG